jgi:hypothetical protein
MKRTQITTNLTPLVFDFIEQVDRVVNDLDNRIALNEDVILGKDSLEALFNLSGSLESFFDALHYEYIELGIFEKGPNGEKHTNGGAESFSIEV